MVKDEEGEWEDLLGSGAVLKRILREGRESDSKEKVFPEYKQYVHIHLIGKVSETGKVFLDTYTQEDRKPIRVEIGDMILQRVDHGVMLAARMMAEGEICAVKVVARYAYGEKGLPPHVPPNADVEYRVELVRIGEFAKEPTDMTGNELISAVTERKERGNYFFKHQEEMFALQCYQQGLKFSQAAEKLEENGETDDSFFSKLYDVRIQLLNNIGAVQEKLEKYKEALDVTTEILAAEPDHLKGLLRAARVCTKRGEFKEASLALARASEYHPGNAAVRRHIKEFKEKKKEYEEKKKSMYGGFISQKLDKKNDSVRSAQLKASSTPESPSKVSENEEKTVRNKAPGSEKTSSAAYLRNLPILFAPFIVFAILLNSNVI